MSGEEKRLIDANEVLGVLADIMREYPTPKDHYDDGYYAGLDRAFEIIEQATTVDAVEVVRCYECKREGTEDCPMVHRDKFFGNLWSEANGMNFCSRGERKDGAES